MVDYDGSTVGRSPRAHLIARAIQVKYPLLHVELQEEMRAICSRNGGPLAHTPNICELWKVRHEELIRMVEDNQAYDPSMDKSARIYAGSPGMVLTEEVRDIVVSYFVAAQDLRKELRQLSDDSLASEYRKLFEESKKKRLEHEVSIDRLAFFSLPEADADFEHWVALPAWSLDEAAALSFGKDPEVVNPLRLAQQASPNSPFVALFKARRRLIERAYEIGELKALTTAADFKSWCDDQSIELPTALHSPLQPKGRREELIEANIALAAKLRAHEASVDAMNSKAKRTVRLLLLAMAVDGYGYRIGGISNTASRLQDVMLLFGLSMNSDTIRDALRDAAADESLKNEVNRIRRNT